MHWVVKLGFERKHITELNISLVLQYMHCCIEGRYLVCGEGLDVHQYLKEVCTQEVLGRNLMTYIL